MNSSLPYSATPLLLFALASIISPDASRATETKIWQEISGEKALAHVQRLVDFGPRPSGSGAIEKSRHYIEDQLRRSGWRVTRQAFTDDTPRGRVQFVNLIAQFPDQGNTAPLFLLCSHYDTETLKLRSYFTYLDREMIDDHSPLNAIGIPTIDVIDFDYPSWHTAGDTIDKISAESLQIVGSVALYYLSEFALK